MTQKTNVPAGDYTSYTEVPELVRLIGQKAYGKPAPQKTRELAFKAALHVLENYKDGLDPNELTQMILEVTRDDEQATWIAISVVGVLVVGLQNGTFQLPER